MSSHRVFLTPAVLREIDQLPAHIRSRVRRSILALREQAQLPQTKPLAFDLPPNQELLRSRIDEWRLIYLVDHEAEALYVLAVRRRPPYSYADLAALVEDVG